jgi:hypothetical protein
MSRDNIGWLKGKSRKHQAKDKSRKHGSARLKWARPLVEQLEQRLAPATTLIYDWGSQHSLGSAAHLTLNLSSDGSQLQIVDNDSHTVASSVPLTDDIALTVNGGPLSDTLTVDLSYTGPAVAPHAITVDFQKDAYQIGSTPIPEIPLTTNSVAIAGGTTVYQPTSFTLTSDADINVTGTMNAVGDIGLMASDMSTGGLPIPGFNILADASANITVNGGTLNGQNITLSSTSTVNIPDSKSLDASVFKVALLQSISSAQVTVMSGNIMAAGMLTISATSTVNTKVDTAGDGSSTDESKDAAFASSIIKSAAGVAIQGGTLTAGGLANLTANNTVTEQTISPASAAPTPMRKSPTPPMWRPLSAPAARSRATAKCLSTPRPRARTTTRPRPRRTA